MNIAIQNNYFTLINVFTVEPVNQQKLVDLLITATGDGVSKAPGFISSALHKSIDGTKVTMYAQWESEALYQQMRANSQASSALTEALKIANFDPGMYEVVKVFSPA
jgi:heme-degrading monooxygenase HmoA